jgi:hypothetical protein
MTLSCRSYIDALSANVQRVYSKTPVVPRKIMTEQYVLVGFFVCAHEGPEGVLVVHLTSQQRTRRRNRITSDCFFF